VVLLATLAWDVVSLAACLVGLLYIESLYRRFKGGEFGEPYVYYVAAAAVLAIGFAARVGLDLLAIVPDDYGLSVRDPAIIAALLLVVVGVRKASAFWERLKPRPSGVS